MQRSFLSSRIRMNLFKSWGRLGAGLSVLSVLASCTLTTPTWGNTSPQPSLSRNPSSAYQITPVVAELEHPWGMAWLPNGEILVTERPGRIRRIRQGQLDPTPISGVPDVFASGQGGLLDIAVHPQFAQNRLVYFTYAAGTAAANRTRLARAVLEGSRLTNLQVIFEVSQTKAGGQHFGSRILWLPDGTMLLSIGDGGNPPTQLEGKLIRHQAQNLKSQLGKILRLRDDGSVPPDNPFVKTANADPRIYSYGHRNIQGLAYDPLNKRVWASEHGSRGGDELNLIRPGQNYGWPVVTHSREYTGGEISAQRSQAGMVDPKLVWPQTVAPSGLAVYTGNRYVNWQGNLFAGGLMIQQVRRLSLDPQVNIRGDEQIAVGQRVRDIRQGPDGLLYILTDAAPNGQLLRLEPRN
jgi:aldose sugar dehydrogenase